MHKVSVIIPVYNIEKYLSRCLDSIINQTYKNLEIICVNDGSTDNSLNILEHYKKLDDRLIIISTKNSGQGAARNTGLEYATGKYTMFADSDDYMSSNMVENLVNCIEESGAEVVTSDFYTNNAHRDINQKYFCHRQFTKIPPNTKFINLDVNNIINYLYVTVTCWGKIFLSDFLKNNNIQFPPNNINDDVIFWADIYSRLKRLSYTPQAPYFYRRRSGSLMKLRNERVFDIIIAHKRVKEIFIQNNMYEKMKNILDYIMIQDFLTKINLLKQPLQEKFFNDIKDLMLDVDCEELKNLPLNDDYKVYIDICKIYKESNYEDFRKLMEKCWVSASDEEEL